MPSLLKLVPPRSPYDAKIWALALPALGALVTEPLYVLADTAVVGHLGTPQLAGLAVASSALLALYSIFIFLAYGTTAAVSRLLGAGDERAAAHQAVQSLWLAGLTGVGVAALGLIAADPLVSLMGASAESHDFALTYLRISLLGTPAMLAVLGGTGYVRGLQDTRTPLVVAAGTALGNLALEVVLIFGLDFGIGASALSTVVAQIAAAAVYVRLIARAATARQVGLRPHGTTIRALIRVGGDLLVRTLALRAALTVSTAVAARMGTVEVAAYQIGWEVWSLLAYALDAVAIAGQAIVGRALGASDEAEARGASWRMIHWGIALGVLFGVLTALSRWLVPHAFTSDPQVIALAGFVLLWVAALQPVNAVAFVLDGVLIGAGDQRFLAKSMVAAAVLFVPLAVGVQLAGLGIGWLWAALGLLMFSRAALLLVRFAGRRWVVLGAPTSPSNQVQASSVAEERVN